MNTTPERSYGDRAKDHLWMHFTRHSSYLEGEALPVIVKGDGCYFWDEHGKRYLDGISSLFNVQVGHGRTELAEAAAKQASELAFFPIWGLAHPRAIELAERVAAIAPGDLNRIFLQQVAAKPLSLLGNLPSSSTNSPESPLNTK